MALAQGSGELIWWPYMVAKYGLTFVCLLIPACLLQYPLNVEIGRYTLVTGESIFHGFIRLGRGFGARPAPVGAPAPGRAPVARAQLRGVSGPGRRLPLGHVRGMTRGGRRGRPAGGPAWAVPRFRSGTPPSQ